MGRRMLEMAVDWAGGSVAAGGGGPLRRGCEALGLAILLMAGGCGGIPLDAHAPAGFDLGGQWVLNAAESDPPPDIRSIQDRADRAFAQGRAGRDRGGVFSFVAQDFPVLKSKSMIIEQNRDSMGIRYDTGAYRDVSWGERKRGLWKVSAGWFEGDLVILSKAADARAHETIRLARDGQSLEVLVEVESEGQTLAARRTFERVPAQR